MGWLYAGSHLPPSAASNWKPPQTHTHTPPGPHTSESWGVKPEERGSRAPGPLQAPLPCPPTGNRSRRVSRAREMSERGDGRCEGKMN